MRSTVVEAVEPTRLYPIIVLFSLVTVEYGGWALLGFITGTGTLSVFRERFFRVGHAHAGVLLVLSLAYFDYLSCTDEGAGGRRGPGARRHRAGRGAREAPAGERSPESTR